MKVRLWSLLLLIWLLLIAVGQADISKGTGARPFALGNAYVGLADDAYSLFTSPAGMAGINKISLISFYSQLDEDANYTSAGVVLPNYWGGDIGIGYRGQTTGNIPISGEVVSYSDQEIILGYAKTLRDNLSLGGIVRLLNKGFSKTVSLYPTANGSGSALDLSLKYQARPWLGAGLAIQNIGGRMSYLDGTVESYNTNFILGTAIKLGGEEGYFKNFLQEAYLNLDLSQANTEPLLWHLGFEIWPNSLVALRCGLDQSAKTSSSAYTHLTGGLGLKTNNFVFDYAFYKQGDESGALTNYFSLGYSFGGGEKTASGATMESPTIPTPESLAIKKIKKVHFTDLPASYPQKSEIEILATAGIMTGYLDGTFRPEEKVTRGEFGQVVAQAKNIPNPNLARPSDLILRGHAASYLEVAGGKERLSEPLTRAELAGLLWQTPYAQTAVKRLPTLEE